MQQLDYRQILLRELETRKSRNPSYNLSSFARLLQIQPSRLSEIFRQKVGLSVAKASEISKILNFSDNERAHFLDLVCIEHGRSPRERADAEKRLQSYYTDFLRFDQEHFSSIADWYHHAISELITLDETITHQEISKALNVEIAKINTAMDRLIKLRVIEKTVKGHKVSSHNRGTSSDIPSDAIKRLNKQFLSKASEEIYRQDVDNRDYSIIFFGFNKDQLKLAKERIRDFRRSFMKEFESSIGKDSVYCMGVQLFELTDKEFSEKLEQKKSMSNHLDTGLL